MTETYNSHGRIITDAKRDSRPFRVTKADIKGAVCKSRTECAIARAIKRSTGAPWIEVRNDVIYVGTGPDTGRRYLHGALSREQVRFFDERGNFAPCSVTLLAPPPHRRIGARRGEAHGTNRRSGTHRAPTR